MKLQIVIEGRSYELEASPADAASSRRLLIVDGKSLEADVVQVEPGVYSVLIEGKSIEAVVESEEFVWVGSTRLSVESRDPRSWSRGLSAGLEHGAVTLKAAMPGKVIQILVEVGEMIETGQGVLVIEAMKMQNEVKSPKCGVVQSIRVVPGDSVSAGQALVVVE